MCEEPGCMDAWIKLLLVQESRVSWQIKMTVLCAAGPERKRARGRKRKHARAV